MEFDQCVAHVLLALETPVRGVVLLFAQLTRLAVTAGSCNCRCAESGGWGRTKRGGNQRHNAKVGRQRGRITAFDLGFTTVVGAGDAVLVVRRLALDQAGEADRAKRVATGRQQAGKTGGLVERVVADAALKQGSHVR